jgi:acetolactate synthase-1/2/3 large subunit
MVLAIGPRLGEMTTQGYSRFQVPNPAQTLVHVHAGAEELGRVYQAARMINSSPAAFAEALVAESVSGDWEDWGKEAAADERAWRSPLGNPGPVQLAQLYGLLRDRLPDDTVVTNGAGNYAAWLHRFFDYRGFKTQLAPTSGAMGYGVPAGIAAALLKPDHPSVAIAGDGCFMMSGNELATAVRYNAKTVFMVMNNGMFGTIRMHQERTYPERLSGTDLTNPDFVAYAKAFGLDAWRVEKTDEFGPALDRALATDGPALLEIMVDQEAIAPSATLSGLRHKA